MVKYTLEEIKEALLLSENEIYIYGVAEREKILKNPKLKRKLSDLQKAGDKLRGTPIYELSFSAFKRFETDGNRFEFESDPERGYFIRRRKLCVFSILSWLYGRKEDIEELENVLWAICSEYTWCLPAHLWGTGLSKLQKDTNYTIDLFASETAQGIAETLTLIGDKLSPIVYDRCVYEVKRRVVDTCSQHWGWQDSKANWVCVCAGNCGIASIYLEKDLDKLANILTVLANCIQNYTLSITDDGACGEGLGYWAYGFGNYIYFADVLYRRTGGRIDLFHSDEKLYKTAGFFSDCLFPKGEYASFADMWGKKIFYALPGLFSKIKEVYPDVRISGYEIMDFSFPEILRLRFGRELREFLWMSERIDEIVEEDYIPHIYPDSELYLATSKNLVSIAAKGGHNDEPHNHNDIGSFMLVKNGKRLLDDIGASEYSADYFKEGRYTKHFAPSSLSHNLPVINGQGQKGGKEYAARNTVIDNSGITLDISGAYGMDELLILKRKLLFDTEKGRLLVYDRFEFSEVPHELSERFVTPAMPEVSDGTIIFKNGNESVKMSFEKGVFDIVCNKVTYLSHDDHTEKETYTVDLFVKELSDKMEFEFTVE